MFVAAITQLISLNYTSITSRTEKLMAVLEFKVFRSPQCSLFYTSTLPGFHPDRDDHRPHGIQIRRDLRATLTVVFALLRMFEGNYFLMHIGMIGIAGMQPFVMNAITKMMANWFPTEESALAAKLATLSLFPT